jgi:hypothetical protein
MTVKHEKDTVNRRVFLTVSAGALAVAASPAALAKGSMSGLGLREGQSLGHGWVISSISKVQAGAVRIIVRHETSNRVANVGICRAEFDSQPIATTGSIDLFLMNNGGDGQECTPDDEVVMIEAMAAQLQGVEESLDGAERLLGRKERQLAYAPIDHLDPIDA